MELETFKITCRAVYPECKFIGDPEHMAVGAFESGENGDGPMFATIVHNSPDTCRANGYEPQKLCVFDSDASYLMPEPIPEDDLFTRLDARKHCANVAKKPYVKPEMKVVVMDSPSLLCDSASGNGYWQGCHEGWQGGWGSDGDSEGE